MTSKTGVTPNVSHEKRNSFLVILSGTNLRDADDPVRLKRDGNRSDNAQCQDGKDHHQSAGKQERATHGCSRGSESAARGVHVADDDRDLIDK